MKQPPFNIFQKPEEIQQEIARTFTCSCGLDYFRTQIIKGSLKRYLKLECPSCGEQIMEDLE